MTSYLSQPRLKSTDQPARTGCTGSPTGGTLESHGLGEEVAMPGPHSSVLLVSTGTQAAVVFFARQAKRRRHLIHLALFSDFCLPLPEKLVLPGTLAMPRKMGCCHWLCLGHAPP